MIDLTLMADEREEASIDKSDLFDFYHRNWDKLVKEIETIREAHGYTLPRIKAHLTDILALTQLLTTDKKETSG